MRAFIKFLKSDSWNLPQKIHPAPDPNPLQPGRPQKLLNGPLVTKGLTINFSCGFPSVPRICHFGDIWATRGELDLGGTEAAGSSA